MGYADSGGLRNCVFLALGLAFFVPSQILTNIWLSSWSNDPVVNGTIDEGHALMRLGVYGVLGAAQRKSGIHQNRRRSIEIAYNLRQTYNVKKSVFSLSIMGQL